MFVILFIIVIFWLIVETCKIHIQRNYQRVLCTTNNLMDTDKPVVSLGNGVGIELQ
jgi:hypothetical protein